MFVNGCFWHGHHCKRGAREPKTNVEYWRTKIARNRDRDRTRPKALRAIGWKALTVWECELKAPDKLTKKIARFLG